jgi:streptomycin 6-kinase
LANAVGQAKNQAMTLDDFQPWLDRWRLTPDGAPFKTRFGSKLLAVRSGGASAMLKIAFGEEERRGADILNWFAGEGAVRILAHDDPALLMERAAGPRSLAAMARQGEDDAAMAILCRAAARLHEIRAAPPPASLVPLDVWFRDLPKAAAKRGGIFEASWAAAQALLAEPRDVRPLHGDLHHDNVLDGGLSDDGGLRGWLAIDPKGLMGEIGFDYANMVCNPGIEVSGAPGVLARRARIVCNATGFAPRRFLTWVLAWTGLSAAWTLDSGGEAPPALEIARLAQAELAGL